MDTYGRPTSSLVRKILRGVDTSGQLVLVWFQGQMLAEDQV